MMNKTTSPKTDNVPKKRGRRAIRILLGSLAFLVVLCAAGATYQVFASRADQRNFPPPGQLYDVGGYRLHLNCTGPQESGNPTVILETMSGGASPYWGWIQPEIAKVTRVCSYDRAGRAWSEPSQHPETLQQTVSDLHTLLQVAAVDGPYVLVGHSIGGIYVRKYAADYPNEVAGIVLIDTAHPDQFVRDPELVTESDTYLRIASVFPALARLGLFHLYFAAGGEIDFQDLPSQQHAEVATLWSSPEYFNSQMAEIIAGPGIFADAHSLGSLGNLPLAVVSRGQNLSTDWAEFQNELVALSSDSIHITVADATHGSLAFNPQDADQVSSSILQVVEAARSSQPLASK